VTPSAAKLGSVCKFRGSHIVPDDGANAMWVCGELLASCDDESAQFEQERECGHLHGYSHGHPRGHSHGHPCGHSHGHPQADRSCRQFAVVRRGLRPSLRGALVLVAMVAATMMAMATTAAVVTREVALLRRGDAMAVCDGNNARMYAADDAGTGTTAEQFARTWAALWGSESGPCSAH